MSGKRRTSRLWYWLLSAFALVALLAVACGDDDDDDDDDNGNGAGKPPIPLVIGQVLPETGALGPLGVPMIEAAQLAVDDINAAGGEITLLEADSGTDPDIATQAVDRVRGEGAQVILGAAASGVTQSFIQTLHDEKIVQCSPSATSPSFSTQENATYFFRTVPPDEAVAPVIADEVAADGHTRIAIVARADDYGNALADLVASGLDELGLESTTIQYDPEATTFDAVIEQVRTFDPDAIVNIGFFFDGTGIIRGLIEAGFGPEIQYGSDGLFLPSLARDIDPNNPNILDGMKTIGASGGEEFNQRLTEVTQGNLIYGGQAYDCVVLLALAAQAAGGTDGDAMIEALGQITTGGTACSSWKECSDLLADGEDINYDGVSGPLDLDEVGDPTFGRYAIAQFQDGELVNIKAVDVDLKELGD